MIKFSALNSNDSSTPEDGDVVSVVTREAQEEEAFGLYRKALGQVQQENFSEALATFKELLLLPFVHKASSDDGKGPLSPALSLKYVALKNLGSIQLQLGDARSAVEAYLDAVEIDSSDVTVWFKMGKLALTLHLYPLARISFEEGLKCSPKHWLCLNNLMTVLYALNDYQTCLHYIARALKLDPGYTKALALRDAIYKEHPALSNNEFFGDCDPSVFTCAATEAEAAEVVKEALALREKRRELYTPGKLAVLPLRKKMREFTWAELGQALLDLYEYIAAVREDGQVSLACRVDLCKSDAEGKGLLGAMDVVKKESPTDSLQQTSGGNSTGDLVICINPPSDPTSQGETEMPQTEQNNPGTLQPMELGGLAEQLTVITREPATPEEIGIPRNAMPGSRRGGKRKRLSLEYLDPSLKRRSARVRNTLRKTQESVNYQELLTPFLPSSLMSDGKDDREDSIPNCSDLNSDHTYGMTPNNSLQDDSTKVVCDSDTIEKMESESVQKFISDHKDKFDLMDLMYNYLHELSIRNHLLWPTTLRSIFVRVYENLRSHIQRPSIFAEEDEAESIRRHGLSTLVYCELVMDKIVVVKAQASPSISPRSPGNQLGPDFPSTQFAADLEFLGQMSVRQGVFKELWLSFALRSFWAEARFQMLSGETESAVQTLEDILRYIDQESKPNRGPIKVQIINCKMNHTITREIVQEQLESLQRCQSLEEVHRLFEQGRFQAVADLLIQTFKKPASRGRKLHAKANIPERHAQLILLQESLWNLKNYQSCLKWGEASLNEALSEFLSAATAGLKFDWSNTIVIVLSDIHRCIKQEKGLLGCLDSTKLTRMAHNIIKLINVQMDVGDSCIEMAIPTVLSWNILYYILKYEEDKIQSLAARSDNKDEPEKGSGEKNGNVDLSAVMPSSLMLLFTAHEYLGRRSWCTTSDGVLLFLSIDVMTRELAGNPATAHAFKEDLTNGIEQCFYCLYGHPSRRGKVKHLQEHNSRQVSLSWERTKQVFDFFKPSIMPEFDSYRTSTVSSELEVLLKRIVSMVPPEQDPAANLDGVVAYVDGGTDKLPSLPSSDTFSPVVQQVYYLLGDYYFKNKEFGKAIRYYMLDICINPNRLDSWAGMALSRSAQLEQRINSCEPKNEGTISKRSISSLRCFKHALEVDPANASLWIEYGSLAYMLQSHISRQLKQSKQFGLGDEAIESLTSKKRELLETAKHCYESANRCEEDGTGNDEMWLNHYLLGKITHKMGRPPKVYLKHLWLSMEHLHDIGARYPKKIQYHSPPPLSIEALELYYKIHAFCMKYLLKYEERLAPKHELKVIWKYIRKAGTSPFADCREMTEETAPSRSPSPVEDDEPTIRRNPKKRGLETDHDYFHHKKHSIGSRDNPISVDSPPEGDPELTIVKEILDCLVTVVSERLEAEAKQKVPAAVAQPRPELRQVPRESKENTELEAQKESLPEAKCRHSFGDASDSWPKRGRSSSAPRPSSSARKEASNDQDPLSILPEPERKQRLLKFCVHAMKECLGRFPQHFKSLHYLARFYSQSKYACNLQLAYDYLMDSGQNRTDMPTPGLFAERKNTNFFTGIWHTPGDEIDRPGSFATHMFRSIVLLIDILERRKDIDTMAYLVVQLSRKPEIEKKYLRDVDREYLAHKVFKTAMGMASSRLDGLMNEEPPPDEHVLVAALLTVYKTWQVFQKAGVFQDEAGEVLAESYKLFKLGEVDSSPPILDQATMFCGRCIHKETLRAMDSALNQDMFGQEPGRPSIDFYSPGPL
ncbi:calcineurin-binding protein cabin-1 [Ixodes scapularis]|nr:calcineurin-binding protein cabin-1 [Ixodes scapularis]